MTTNKTTEYKFNLGDIVDLKFSDEFGEVIARAEYTHESPTYLVMYKTGDNRQTTAWWNDSALTLKTRGEK